MIKKLLATVLAVMLMVSFSAVAYADPTETPAVTESPAPVETIAPTAEPTIAPTPEPTPVPTIAPTTEPVVTPAPTEDNSIFIQQVKAMRAEVKVLSTLLKTEKKLQGEIKEILRVLKMDKEKIKANTEQVNALTKKLRDLEKDLRQYTKGGKNKTVDQAKVDEMKAAILAAETELAKYKSLAEEMKGGHKYGNRSHKAVREMLKPEYDKLDVLSKEAKKLKVEINKLTGSLEEAVEAGNLAGAEDLVLQIRAKVDLLKANLNARIEIYRGMRKILQDYKAQLQAVPTVAPAATTNP